MGFGTVFAMLSFLLIFAAGSVLVINSQNSITAAATQVKEEQMKLLVAQQQEIEITATSYGENLERDWMQTYNDDFNTGTFENTLWTADSVELDAFSTSGSYASEIYDTGYVSNYTAITWSSVMPANTNVTFQIRTANNTTALAAAPYIGPDGTANTAYYLTGSALHASHDNSRFIQFRANLTSSAPGTTPTLSDVTIGVIRDSGASRLSVTNTGKTKLNFEETDVYVDGVRLLRAPSERVYEFEITSDERLWNPGEEANFTIFTNISIQATITIVNQNAKDQEVVLG